MDSDKRILPPKGRVTKRAWVSFYNREAEKKLKELGRLPKYNPDAYTENFHEASNDEMTPEFWGNGLPKKWGNFEPLIDI